MRGISKIFPGVRALEDVSLEIRAGEVHGAARAERRRQVDADQDAVRGVSPRSVVEFLFKGVPVRIGSSDRCRAIGHRRHLPEVLAGAVSSSVAQNIFLGREFPRAAARQYRPHGAFATRRGRVLTTLGLDLDTHTPAHRLRRRRSSRSSRSRKRCRRTREVLVMDEPTAALSGPEIDGSSAIIRKLKQDGVAIVYISHRLPRSSGSAIALPSCAMDARLRSSIQARTDPDRARAHDGRSRE